MTDSNAPATLQELEDAITELEAYRERLVNDMMTMAQKAKISKSQMMANLEPELQQIDRALAEMRTQRTSAVSAN